MIDYKHTKPYKHHEHKPLGLLKGFYIACGYSAFCGLIIGLLLNAITNGNLLP